MPAIHYNGYTSGTFDDTLSLIPQIFGADCLLLFHGSVSYDVEYSQTDFGYMYISSCIGQSAQESKCKISDRGAHCNSIPLQLYYYLVGTSFKI